MPTATRWPPIWSTCRCRIRSRISCASNGARSRTLRARCRRSSDFRKVMAATLPAARYEKAERAEPVGRPPRARRAGRWADALFSVLAHSAAILTLLLLAGIIVSLIVGAAPAIREYGLSFLWRSDWDPVRDQYGGLPMIYGTLATSAIALVIAVPVSFGIALFLTELSPGWLRRPLGTAIELLAAVPSIVYGML